MYHRSAAHRAPKSVWLPGVLGGAFVVLTFAVALRIMPWWLALLLWAGVAACALAVERLKVAQGTFDRITTFGSVDQAPSEQTVDDEPRASSSR